MWSCRGLSAVAPCRWSWWGLAPSRVAPARGERASTTTTATTATTTARTARLPGQPARRDKARAAKGHNAGARSFISCPSQQVIPLLGVPAGEEVARGEGGSSVGNSGGNGEWSTKEEQPLGEFVASVAQEAVTHGAMRGRPSAAVASAVEMAAQGLLDLGFSQHQVRCLVRSSPAAMLPSAPHDQAGAPAVVSSLRALLALGLSRATCMRAVTQQPQLALTDALVIQGRGRALRRHGLGEGWLEHAVASTPELLAQTERSISERVNMLRSDCLFNGKQSQEIARTTPRALLHTPYHLQFTFQYAYFRMGMSHAEMVTTRIFGADQRRVRTRHQFLERRGLFSVERSGPHATPDPRGPSQPGLGSSQNPKAAHIIRLPDGVFLTKLANGASKEELEVFSRLLAREELDEESQEGEDSENELEVEEEVEEEAMDNSGSDSEEESDRRTRRKP
uniref:Transcription termination factor 4, mitochondrial-like n=1 Tax=Petromyzon marinus TaxID=7757 RepID=A0AAJ7TS73_PETMA|nr:transcription termination factor 4, mitochondrial-like [Petromyzon marinus]